ncbi:MAG: transporter substrate-binding domain-containing protein [Rhodospirillaceae bacterium]|nr:transporter substrate-binding domain-containing protein [Rhodospirillaceae bacterium]
MRIGIYQNEPKIFLDEAGQPSGFFPELLAAIAADNAWQLVYVSCAWADCLTMLQDGSIDVLPDVARTPEREALFIFNTQPALNSWSNVYVPADSEIATIAQLDGAHVAVLEGSVQQAALLRFVLRHHVTPRMVTVSSMEGVLAAVAAGQADAGVVNNYFGALHAETYGLVATEIVLQPTSLYFAVSPHASATLVEALDTSLVLLKADPDSAYYDAMRHWVDVSGAASGLPPWAVWAITSLLALAIAGLAATAYLKQVVRVRTAALRSALDRAEAASNAKSEFLWNMSHDLRTPLNSIIGFSELILTRTYGDLANRKYREYVEDILSCGQTLSDMIGDILDLSKIESGHYTVTLEWLDMVEVIGKARERFAPLLMHAGDRQLRMTLRGGARWLKADRRAIGQIIDNLVGNAMKHAGPNCTIDLGWDADPGAPGRLFVADDGCGIPEGQLASVTEPFVQGGEDFSRPYTKRRLTQGVGLGLSIVAKLAKLQNGQLRISSSAGQGATFTIEFPAAQVAERPAAEDGARARSMASQRRLRASADQAPPAVGPGVNGAAASQPPKPL